MRALSWIGLAVVARAFCPSGLAARPALRARAPLRASDDEGAACDDDDAPIDLGDDFDWRKARAALVSAEKGGAALEVMNVIMVGTITFQTLERVTGFWSIVNPPQWWAEELKGKTNP